MKQYYYDVHIRRDAVETTSREAASSEIPVLQAIYGDAVIVDKKSATVVDRPEISGEEEYRRLVARYGQEAVIGAYGTQFSAVNEIEKLFREAEGSGKTPQQKTAGIDKKFLKKAKAKIIEAIPDLSDEELSAYLESEKNSAEPREDIIAAFVAEAAKRDEEDKGDDGGGGDGDDDDDPA